MNKSFVGSMFLDGPASRERHAEDVKAAIERLAQGTEGIPVTVIESVSDTVGEKLQSIGFSQNPIARGFNPYTSGRR